jgi:hypothetical protein
VFKLSKKEKEKEKENGYSVIQVSKCEFKLAEELFELVGIDSKNVHTATSTTLIRDALV